MNNAVFKALVVVVGEKAVGKGVLCDRLAADGFVKFRFSDPIREEAKKQGLPNATTRELQDIANQFRRAHGAGYWSGRFLALAAERAAASGRVVIDGARNPAEIVALQEAADCAVTLVGIRAPTELRWRRFLLRTQDGDVGTTLEKFLEIDDRESGLGQPVDGQHIDRCMAMVPLENVYNNDGTLDEYRAWIDAFAARHGW